MPQYLLGYDIGSSSVKAALVDVETRQSVQVTHSPSEVMPIHAPKPGWAEQDPEMWWTHVCKATKELLHRTTIDPKEIRGIGIAYQMHGLVCVDEKREVLRPSIIWCDSRAVEIGDIAFDAMGHDRCLQSLLNSPGNFTASKLAWVKQHEPEVYQRIAKFMLPGDYIAMKFTGEITTTPAALSEGILWSYTNEAPAHSVFDHFGFDKTLIPEIRPVFSAQGIVNAEAAAETGLNPGTPVGYRAGDQPNNALALGVLNPGQIAASGGTSGVVYGISTDLIADERSRVNSFMHVNHTRQVPRVGILLCINGAGSQYNWTKQNIAGNSISYIQMEQRAAGIPVGSDGLVILPFGNGAERMLGNINPGAHMMGLDFNIHGKAHLYRAALEGIAFAFVYGIEVLRELGLRVETIRVGNDNLFQSEIFTTTISTLSGTSIDMVETTGAAGAAKAAGVATGVFNSVEEAFGGLQILKTTTADSRIDEYIKVYSGWTELLSQHVKK